MAFTYEYFYTVQVETTFITLSEINSGSGIIDLRGTDSTAITDVNLQGQFGDYVMTHLEQNMVSAQASPPIVDSYGVYTGPPSAAGPYATQIRSTQYNKFRYTLRFYLKKTNTSNNEFTYYWLNEAAVKNIKIKTTASTLEAGGVNIDKDKKRGFSGLLAAQQTSPNSDTENQSVNFWFMLTNKGKTKATFDPPFTVSADIFPDKVAYRPSAGAVRIQADKESAAISGTISLAGLNPQIYARKSRETPTIPPQFKAALEERTFKYSTSLTDQLKYQYVYDLCNKQWIGFKIGRQTGTANITYSFLTSSLDGTTITQGANYEGKYTTGKSEPNLRLMEKKLYDAQLGQCGDKLDTNLTNEPEKPAQVFPPVDAQRWNPPPHIASKGIPFGIRAGIALDSKGQPFNPDEFTQLNGKYKFIGDDGRLERGRIFQDKLSAEVMNRSALSLGTGSKAKAKQWGFRFMYNPEVIGYSTSGNNSIDWTFGSKDSATSLTGNQSVKVELLISRISDLSFLNMAAAKRDETAAYGRPLQDEERYGLLNRGTEYDLEFLYRCLNGDPEENTMLLDENYGANIGHKEYRRSSDIGYITGIPLWMYLGPNLRYFGSVTGINVTHKIFDLNMVPMLSVVAIDFTRYPAQFNIEGETGIRAIGTIGGVDPASTSTTPTP
jgi:hypothetical protein